jgi:hypothetical protein
VTSLIKMNVRVLIRTYICISVLNQLNWSLTLREEHKLRGDRE